MSESKRDALRAKILGKTHQPKKELITVFGVEFELRQPSLAAILNARESKSLIDQVVDMIIDHAFVPGTDERLFESTDRELIKVWPFGEDLITLQRAIAKLSGVNIGEAEEQLKK